MNITFFNNGNTIAFENGQQVPIAQEPWILTYVRYLVENGIDPTRHNITLPNGERAKIFKTEGGYNWEINP